MNIDIRKHIIDNFKNTEIQEIRNSIDTSISENDEITLPGIGVLFELLWKNSDEASKEYILNTLKNALNN